MRILKIILFIYTIIVFAIGSYLSWFELSRVSHRLLPISYETYAYHAIFIISAALAVMYHAKSIHYYRKMSFQHIHKKLHIIYYFGVFMYNVGLLFITFFNVRIYIEISKFGQDYSRDILLTIFLMFFPAILGFWEMYRLNQHIKYLQKDRALKEEINAIGIVNE